MHQSLPHNKRAKIRLCYYIWVLSGAKDANTQHTSYLRTRLGYRVTGQTFKSYYILGSTTKLASWTAPGVTFLGFRCNAESVYPRVSFFTRLERNAFLASLKSWLVPILGMQLDQNAVPKLDGEAKTTFGQSNLVHFR